MALNILISNDDGVEAPGIKVLAETLRSIAKVTIVAPESERSTTGHTLSLNQPLRVRDLGNEIYACDGYPADCVFWALNVVMAKNPPDLVISGINRGANLAQDYYYSGTVAAAREANVHNIPSIAVSSVFDWGHQGAVNYETASFVIKSLLETELPKMILPQTLLNVNVPNTLPQEIRGAKITSFGLRFYGQDVDHRLDTRGRDYYWIGGIYKGHQEDDRNGYISDCSAVDQGFVSITPVDLRLREIENINNLKTCLEEDWKFHL